MNDEYYELNLRLNYLIIKKCHYCYVSDINRNSICGCGNAFSIRDGLHWLGPA